MTMEQVLALAEAHVFTESEIIALYVLAIDGANRAVEHRQYGMARGFITDAQGHLDALLRRRQGKRNG